MIREPRLSSLRRSQDDFKQSSVSVYDVPPDADNICGSFSILCRWKNSLYKMIWRHMLLFIFAYIILSLLYNCYFDEEGKKNFDELTEYFWRNMRSFQWVIMLGFFTNTSLHRLFQMQLNMPGTGKATTVFLMSLKPGLPEGRFIIDLYSRWTFLAWVLTFRIVSKPLKERYPDLPSMVNEGILTPNERLVLEEKKLQNPETPQPLIVIDWMLLLIKETAMFNRFHNRSSLNKSVDTLMQFKKSCSNVLKFSTQNIPMAIIQAVIIAVYCSGGLILMARNLPKFAKSRFTSEIIIPYVPIMPAIQFFIYIAWLSFGRAAVNPFGEDDTDINIRKLAESHQRNSERLRELYAVKLGDIFPESPQNPFNIVKSKDVSIQTTEDV